jgi:hypothetical protein
MGIRNRNPSWCKIICIRNKSHINPRFKINMLPLNHVPHYAKEPTMNIDKPRWSHMQLILNAAYDET